LSNQGFHALQGLLIQVGKVCPEVAGQNQIVEPDRMVFFEVIPVHTAPLADGPGFLRQIQIRDEVIPGADVRDILGQASFDWFVP